MVSRYNNVTLPLEMVKVIDYLIKKVKPFGYTSRPELVKELVRRHIEELLRLKLIEPHEIRSL